MACDFCNGDTVTLEDTTKPWGEGAILVIEGNKLNAVGIYDGGYCSGVATATINFCPKCGRDMQGDADERA